MPVSVDSKQLTQTLSPLDATLMKNIGGGPVMVNQKILSGFRSLPSTSTDPWSLHLLDWEQEAGARHTGILLTT
jgi:hypothetical protein